MQNESFSPQDGPETAPAETETAKQKFERERLTRRQALKKFGMTSAMATFALFSVDDLARMVGAAMERQAKNSKIAEQVAKEFEAMGVASAYPSYTNNDPNCVGCGSTKDAKDTAARTVLGNCNDNCQTNPTLAVPDPCGCLCQNAKSVLAACVEAQGCCAKYNCDCGPAYPCRPLPAGCT